jgi:hypothetical protein
MNKIPIETKNKSNDIPYLNTLTDIEHLKIYSFKINDIIEVPYFNEFINNIITVFMQNALEEGCDTVKITYANKIYSMIKACVIFCNNKDEKIKISIASCEKTENSDIIIRLIIMIKNINICDIVCDMNKNIFYYSDYCKYDIENIIESIIEQKPCNKI